ncbi:hypothetical protein HYH02_001623 [Chlamydomonas schloesseri]|uniref:Uncharacterized protein n=1 Tax=Chlamydomonas schloesseri TaxID=2026947 RepID=A0A836BC25_9CHLO|nr:hypothetical protein HYH02_001623 [Chlamydomonas schloesseri]|eukprot:KAG2453399.1 hypothetical protein HYH02_001623 [Chlamydomonas schloesseri]
MGRRNETEEERAERKAALKAAKAAKRDERQGLGDPEKGRKPCSLCGRSRDLLVRCQVDATGTWHMACGKCWMSASGGAVDGSASRPHYRYGGLWKNHHQAKSGRNKVPAAARATAAGRGGKYKAESGSGSGSGSDGEGGGDARSGEEADVAVAAGGGGAGMQAELLREAAECEAEDKAVAGKS